MPHRSVVISSSVGLHARPAAIFSRAVARAGVPITISRRGGVPVNAGSLLMVLGLGLRFGDAAELTAEGPGAEEALEDLAHLLATDFDAPSGS